VATTSRDELKRQAAEAAVDLIESGMVVGLGFGSTAVHAVRRIGALLAEGRLRDIVGVPCSVWTEREARRLGIPLTTLDERPLVDLTIDGADEVDPQLDLIKGGGGALLREKIVAQASSRHVIVVDEAKLSPALGTLFAVPVEVVPFGAGALARFIAGLGAKVCLRRDPAGAPIITDQGNYLLHCGFGPISDPAALAATLKSRAGIVEHGLFLGLATDLIVAGNAGMRYIRR
jgi:ribose 5-phosphate isomerase A